MTIFIILDIKLINNNNCEPEINNECENIVNLGEDH